MIGLTSQMQKCLGFIKAFEEQTGVIPNYSEIADGLGNRSKGNVHRLIVALEERGAIRRIPGKARAIEVVPENETRMVNIADHHWIALVRYCIAEGCTMEQAVNRFVRDGLESA